jgi:hypothetical protein
VLALKFDNVAPGNVMTLALQAMYRIEFPLADGTSIAIAVVVRHLLLLLHAKQQRRARRLAILVDYHEIRTEVAE